MNVQKLIQDLEDLKDKEIQFKDMPEKQKNKTLQEMNLLLQDLRHIGNSVGFDKDVPELDNITKRDVKSMNKIAYIRQAVEKAINPKEKAPKRKILCRTKQSNKEKSQSLGTGQERMLLLQRLYTKCHGDTFYVSTWHLFFCEEEGLCT